MSPDSAHGCRYNIRDIGFVDLGRRGLSVEVYSPTPQQAADAASKIRARLQAEHIRTPVLSFTSKGNHHLSLLRDGKRTLDIYAGSDPSLLVERSIKAVLPPASQAQWQETLIDHPCLAVLLLSGDKRLDKDATKSLTEGIALAIEEADLWEKPMTGVPQLVSIKPGERAEWSTVLWSLGFPDNADGPAAAVLHGRLRRIGPILQGDALAPARVSSTIGLLGRDCECELPRTLFFGPSPPHPWPARLAEQARQALGFDPDHPMVQLEVRQIATHEHPSAERLPLDDSGMFLGYEEIDIDSLLPQEQASARATDDTNRVARQQGTPQAPPNELAPPEQSGDHRLLYAAAVVVVLCSVAVGWWLSRSQ